MWASALLLTWLGGCASAPTCRAPEDILAQDGDETLTCDEAQRLNHYVHLLAGRPMTPRERSQGLSHVRERWRQDPVAGEAWITEVGSAVDSLLGQRGIAGAENRAQMVYEVMEGRGQVGPDDGGIWSVL